ncbi:MAG: hypothetical protein ABW069_09125 [Duganella sp.]
MKNSNKKKGLKQELMSQSTFDFIIEHPITENSGQIGAVGCRQAGAFGATPTDERTLSRV